MYTPLMHAPWKRSAAIALAVCGFSILPLISGCKTDVEKADETVSADIDTATQDLEKGGPDAATAAMKTLQKTPGTKGASASAQIESNQLLAQSELDAAEALINGADGIASREGRIAGVIGNMNTLALELGGNNTYIAGYRSLEPTAALKAAQQASESAEKGDGNGAWFAGPPPLLALTAVKQKQAELQKQIDDLNGQIKDLTAKRAEALKQVDAFTQQADSTTGKSSVGFYVQASNQRKEAADDDTKIQQIQGQLVPLNQDLAVAQDQQKSLEVAIAGYADQQQKLNSGWKNLQQQIDIASGFSKTLLDGSGASAGAAAPADASAAPQAGGAASAGAETPTSAPSAATSAEPARNLAALAAELDAQVQAVQGLRSKAVGLLNDSYQHYDTALNLAIKFTAELNKQAKAPDLAKLPERHAWQMLIDINQPASFKLRQSAVQGRLARLYADEYSELAQRNQLSRLLGPALRASGMQAPAALSSLISADNKVPPDVDDQVKKVESDVKQGTPNFKQDSDGLMQQATGQVPPVAQQVIAGAQANLAFAWSLSLLGDVADNSGQGEMASLLKDIGSAQQMSDNYGWAQFASMEGRQQDSDNRLKAAIAARDVVAGDNARYLLPSVLPPGLEFAAKAAPPSTTAPANVSTTLPTASPAGLPETVPSPATQPATTEPASPFGGVAPPATEPAAPQAPSEAVPTATAPATAPAQ